MLNSKKIEHIPVLINTLNLFIFNKEKLIEHHGKMRPNHKILKAIIIGAISFKQNFTTQAANIFNFMKYM